MKIGIGVPCHKRDEFYLQYCAKSIENLDPPPDVLFINVNEDGLKKARDDVFNHLFSFHKCDVALQCSADFYLFPDILKYVSNKQVVSFAGLSLSIGDPIRILGRFVSPRAWTACYSIPSREWSKIKDRWDGTDGSVKNLIKNHRFIHKPKFYWMKRSERRFQYAKGKRGLSKLKRMLVAYL